MSLRATFVGLNHTPAPPPVPVAPAAPTGLTATPTGANRDDVLLSWTDPNSGLAQETGYEIEYDSGGGWAALATTAADATTYTHTTPTLGVVTHSYRVRAVNGAGNSAWAVVTLEGWRLGTVALWEFGGDALDAVGSNNFTLVNSPAYVAGLGGKQAIQLVGASGQHLTQSPDAALTFAGDWAIWYFSYFDNQSGSFNQVLDRFGGTSNGQWAFSLKDNGTVEVYVLGASGSPVAKVVNLPLWAFIYFDFRASDKRARLIINDAAAVEVTLGLAPLHEDDLKVGVYTDGVQSPLDAKFQRMGFTNRLLSDDEREALRTSLHIPAYKLVAEGDSLTQGIGGTAYPAQLGTLIGGQWMVANFGAGGQTLATMLADTSAVAAAYDASKDSNILCLWAGTNDLFFGGSVADVMDDYEAYCTWAQGAGYQVVVFTMLPRSDVGTPGTFEADRQTFNTWLRANYATFADALADVAANTNIGDAGDELNTTYYNADKVHMTTTGYGVVAGIAAAAIEGL